MFKDPKVILIITCSGASFYDEFQDVCVRNRLFN